jgi:hypothetical protein
MGAIQFEKKKEKKKDRDRYLFKYLRGRETE